MSKRDASAEGQSDPGMPIFAYRNGRECEIGWQWRNGRRVMYSSKADVEASDKLRAALAKQTPDASAEGRPSPMIGRRPREIILYSGDTTEPYIDIDGSDLWCNAEDFHPDTRWKIRWMVDAARAAIPKRAPKPEPEYFDPAEQYCDGLGKCLKRTVMRPQPAPKESP